ncbi:MAG TPA: hypothetical protein VGQ83_42620 [Polyangia bacterium]|jgi:hypothetical protein
MEHRASQAEHARLVSVIAGTLVQRGETDVKAAAPGYRPPTPIRWRGDEKGHVPDVTAHGLVIEVETADLIGAPATAARWQLTAGYAERIDAAFIVVVPKAAVPSAESALAALRLDAQVIGA